MLRRHLLAAAALLAGTAVIAHAQAQTVPVGSAEILSGGPNSAYGIAIKNGLELGLDEVNERGVLGGRKIALTVEDTANTKEGAINAVRKLIGRDHVVAIIGPTLSDDMFAAGPVANERKTPIIGTSTTANGITAIGDYVFRTSLPEADVIPVTLKKAMDKGAKTIALIYVNDSAFAKSGFDVMKAAAEKAGLTILDIESFAGKDTDVSAQLTKIKSLNPDAVGISALSEQTASVLLGAQQLGFPASVQFLGGNGANSPKVIELAGKAAEGMMVGSPWFIGKPDAQNVKFVQAYQARFKASPDQFAAQAFDAIHILAAAIDTAGAIDGDKVRTALLQTKYDGVMGPASFTADRNPASTQGVVVLTVQDGKFGIAK